MGLYMYITHMYYIYIYSCIHITHMYTHTHNCFGVSILDLLVFILSMFTELFH